MKYDKVLEHNCGVTLNMQDGRWVKLTCNFWLVDTLIETPDWILTRAKPFMHFYRWTVYEAQIILVLEFFVWEDFTVQTNKRTVLLMTALCPRCWIVSLRTAALKKQATKFTIIKQRLIYFSTISQTIPGLKLNKLLWQSISWLKRNGQLYFLSYFSSKNGQTELPPWWWSSGDS